MKNALIIFLLCLLILSPVYANEELDAFNEEPTKDNFKSLTPQEQEQNFHLLPPAEKESFFTEKIGATVSLGGNNVQYVGGNLINNGMTLSNLESLSVQGVIGITATATGFQLEFADEKSASIDSSTGPLPGPVYVTQSSSGNSVINIGADTYEIVSGKVVISSNSGITTFSNKADSGIPATVKLNKQTTNGVLTDFTLQHEGKLDLLNTQDTLQGTITKGTITVNQKGTVEGKSYEIEQSFTAFNSLNFGTTSSINNLVNSLDNSAYAIINSESSWQNQVTKKGVTGAGGSIIGTGVEYSVKEISDGTTLVDYTYTAPTPYEPISGNPVFIYGGSSESSPDAPKIYYSPPYRFIGKDGSIVNLDDTEDLIYSSVVRSSYTATLENTFPGEATIAFKSGNDVITSENEPFTSVGPLKPTSKPIPSYTILEPEALRKAQLAKNSFSIDTSVGSGHIKGDIYITDYTEINTGGFLGKMDVPSSFVGALTFIDGNDVISCLNCKGTITGDGITLESPEAFTYKVGTSEFIVPKNGKIELNIRQDENNMYIDSMMTIPEGQSLNQIPLTSSDPIILQGEISDATIRNTLTIPKNPAPNEDSYKLTGTYALSSGKIMAKDGKIQGSVSNIAGEFTNYQMYVTSIDKGNVLFSEVFNGKDIEIDLSSLSSNNIYDFSTNTLLTDSESPIPTSVLGSSSGIQFLSDLDFSTPTSIALYGDDLNGVGSIVWSGVDDTPVITFDALSISNNFAKANVVFSKEKLGLIIKDSIQDLVGHDGTVKKSLTIPLSN